MKYEFSEPTLKEDTAGGGRVAIAAGRLQIKHWLMRYQDSGEFDVKVESKIGGNAAQVYKFTGRLVGGGENIIGSTKLTSGDFKFPIMIKSDRAKITLKISHLPCQFSFKWEELHLRAREMNKYLRITTKDDIDFLAPNLRQADINECLAATGCKPVGIMLEGLKMGDKTLLW